MRNLGMTSLPIENVLEENTNTDLANIINSIISVVNNHGEIDKDAVSDILDWYKVASETPTSS